MDSNSKGNIDKLNREIIDVHKIFAESISLIMEREKTLNSIYDSSVNIKHHSDTFAKEAYKTRMKLLLSKYSIFIAIGAILILFIIFKFYF
jgi:vesicle transport protein SEC22